MNPLYLELLEPFKHNTTLLELGNKRYRGTPYRHYYESFGIQYTAVDLNGLDGALAMDLTKPLGLGRFDIVTNWGTTEHVWDQMAVWNNIADAVDDLFVSATPAPGHHPTHGMYYPTEEFYRRFACHNGMNVERLYTHPTKNHVFARLKRTCRTSFVFPGMEHIFHNAESDAYNE